MSQFTDLLGDLRDATHGFFGDACKWGIDQTDATVIVNAWEEALDFGRTSRVLPSHVLKVRVSEIAQPVEGEFVTIVAGGAQYQIIGDPKRGPKLDEWLCEAVKQA